MPIRTVPKESAWVGDFVRPLTAQYKKLGLTPPAVLDVVAGNHSAPELLRFFGDQAWVPQLDLQSALTSYAKEAKVLLPVVDDAPSAKTHLPAEIQAFNAFLRGRHGGVWPEALVDEVLALTWQRRRTRRIFISYRRTDAEGVALQLHERYTKVGFDVFLDDVTIQRGADFQAELRRWLDDADAVLLLVSPELESSEWVRKEIELAKTRRVGLLAIVWPSDRFPRDLTSGHTREPANLAQVPADRELRLDATRPLDGDIADPSKQRLGMPYLPEVDHLLFTGRSQAIASRVRDLIDRARVDLETEFTIGPLGANGDVSLTRIQDGASWLARVVSFRPEVADLWRWWKEHQASGIAGIRIIYPELDESDERAIALRQIANHWGRSVTPLVELRTVRV